MTESTGRRPRLTDEQRRQFFWLRLDERGPKLSIRAASQQAGISEHTGRRIAKGAREAKISGAVAGRDLSDPKPLARLSADARAALADFNLFGEMFFALRPAPWRRDAAMRIVDAIADHGQRTFLDMNVFPGAGKTTLIKVVVAWVIAGGGVEDPAAGRAIRIMLGSETQKVARHMLRNVRLPLELRRPFAMFDKGKRVWIQATHTLGVEYGRFKPDTRLGEESLWSQDQILVAQLAEVDLVLKEPTIQVASKEMGFLGERVDLAIWDDLATTKNSRNPEIAEALNVWFENEAETRVETGGVCVVVGQRLSPLDLHRKRLDAKVENEAGEQVSLYHHITYPAHHDRECDGKHRQWDPATGTGCMTDIEALPVRDWANVKSKQDYRTVYQQEDADPEKILVQLAWLEGGPDIHGEWTPGCFDRERGFHEWPEGTGTLIDYATLDPAAGNWWALEWWAVQPESRHNYLIEGRRAKIQAGAFLDWDNAKQEFRGWMHEVQVSSILAGHPIRVWIVEANAAHKYLQQFEHFRRWKQMFPFVAVVPHETGGWNKNDPEFGVEALLPGRYRTGLKHIPRRSGDIAALNFVKAFTRELTTYPYADTSDTVMADWMGETNLDKIIALGRRSLREEISVDPNFRPPPYLERQSHEETYA